MRRCADARWIALLLLLVALGGCGGSTAAQAAPTTPAPTRLVYVRGDDLQVIDMTSGRVQNLAMPAPRGQIDTGVVAVGSHLVLDRDEHAWSYPTLSATTKPIDLGPAEQIIPGPWADRVWLSYGHAVRLVRLDGRRIGGPYSLPGPTNEQAPGSWGPTGIALADGILLESTVEKDGHVAENDEQVWDPVTDRTVRSFIGGWVSAAAGHLVVWQPTGCPGSCPLVFDDLATGAERTLSAPAGMQIGVASPISPDGQRMMVGLGTNPPSITTDERAMIDLSTLRISAIVAEPLLSDDFDSWSASGDLYDIEADVVLRWRTDGGWAVVPGVPGSGPRFSPTNPSVALAGTEATSMAVL